MNGRVVQRPSLALPSLPDNRNKFRTEIWLVTLFPNLCDHADRRRITVSTKHNHPSNYMMMAAFGRARMAQAMSRRLAAGVSTPSIPSYRPANLRAVSPLSTQYGLRRPSNPQTSPYRHRRPVLEVERKFAPTATSIRQLDQNAGEPAFESVVHKGITCFEDTYYDTPKDTLSKAGVWIRRREKLECGARRFAGHKRLSPRDASWEAKVRVGGDFTNSAFEETTDVREISALLGTLVPGSGLDAHLGPRGGEVTEMARFVTDRTGYVVDGRFTVVIDVTDFGHTVGEVELERDATEASCEGEVEVEVEDRTLAIAAMDKEIDCFMRRFLWAFPKGKPVGKLTAYFDHKTGRSLREQS